MISSITELIPETCYQRLQAFWKENLEVEAAENGVVLALPLQYPDGFQVVVHVEEKTPGKALLSDKGRTLCQLIEQGLHFERKPSQTRTLLIERLNAFGINQEGLNLSKGVKLPLQGLDVHLFAETLVSIAHLFYRYEPAPAKSLIAYDAVQHFLQEKQIVAKKRYNLEGKIEKDIKVDFFVERTRPIAIKVVKRTKGLRFYMEQWGWRWTDLKCQSPDICKTMVYDPDNQEWDSISLDIGNAVCDHFFPYQDMDEMANLMNGY